MYFACNADTVPFFYKMHLVYILLICLVSHVHSSWLIGLCRSVDVNEEKKEEEIVLSEEEMMMRYEIYCMKSCTKHLPVHRFLYLSNRDADCHRAISVDVQQACLEYFFISFVLKYKSSRL